MRISLFTTIRLLWKSPWTVWVGYRYLKSKKSSRFLSFITGISIAGVALGVGALLVVISVMDGFEKQLKERLLSFDLHVLVTPQGLSKDGKKSTGQRLISKTELEESPFFLHLQNIEAESPEKLKGFWPILATEAILKHGRRVKGVVLKGVGEKKLAKVQETVVERAEAHMLVERTDDQVIRYPGVFVGQELAYEMGLIPGDFVTMVSPNVTTGPLGMAPRTKRFVIEGVYHSGVPEDELQVVFLSYSSVTSFIRKRDVYSQVEVSLTDFEKARDLADKLKTLAIPRKGEPGFKVLDWVDMNASLFASLKLERLSMFVILTFIIIVASFNIITTLTMMVLEKKKEVCILKAMGAGSNHVGAIFLSEGLMIGTSGVIIGLVSAYVLSILLQRYEFISLPDIYYDRTLPVTFNPVYYALVAICAFLIVLVACIYPSRRAFQTPPLEGIRS